MSKLKSSNICLKQGMKIYSFLNNSHCGSILLFTVFITVIYYLFGLTEYATRLEVSYLRIAAGVR
jgi:hypothetical protein